MEKITLDEKLQGLKVSHNFYSTLQIREPSFVMVFYAAVLSSQIIVIKIAAVLSKFLKKENSRTVNLLSCKWVT